RRLCGGGAGVRRADGVLAEGEGDLVPGAPRGMGHRAGRFDGRPMRLTPKPVAASQTVFSKTMLPSDANPWGNVHGGALMRPSDESGGGWHRPRSDANGGSRAASIPPAARRVEMKSSRILSVAMAALLVGAACQAPRATSGGTTPPASAGPDFTGKTLNIATGGTGGVYIVYGAGLADMLSKKMKVAASPQTTPASVDNMKLIRDGKADLAFTLADTAFDAINGKGRFAPPEAKVDAKTNAVMYSNYMHIAA